MSQIDHLMRYVADVDSPNLLKLFDAEVARMTAEQGRTAMAGFWRSWGKRPGAIRAMLSHTKPLPILEMCKVAAFLQLPVAEASALWMANAPAKVVGGVMRAYRATREVERAARPVYCLGIQYRGLQVFQVGTV